MLSTGKPSISELRRDAMMIEAVTIVRNYGFVSLTCASVANACTRRGTDTSVSLVKHYYGNRAGLCSAVAEYAKANGFTDVIGDATRLGWL